MSEFSVPPVASGGAARPDQGAGHSAWPFLSALIYANAVAVIGFMAIAVAAMEYDTVTGCAADSWPLVGSLLGIATTAGVGLFALMGATAWRDFRASHGPPLAGRLFVAGGLLVVLLGLMAGVVALWASALQSVTCG